MRTLWLLVLGLAVAACASIGPVPPVQAQDFEQVDTLSSQTLQNKTLDSTNTYNGGTFTQPTITTPTITNPTITGTVAGGATYTRPVIGSSTTASLPVTCTDNALVVVTDGTRGLRRCKGNVWMKPTEVSVDEFGAKGDAVFSYAGSATGTDDAVAIQAALDAVFAGGETVRFGCKKYLTSRLIYKGQSLHGCSAANQDFTVGTLIIGKPQQDVFYAPDPSLSETGAQGTLGTIFTRITDITVVVDNSAAHTFGTTRRVYPTLGLWTTATAYGQGDWVTNSAGKIYAVVGPEDGGTSGGSEPTHTSGRARDGGGVRWEYIAPAQLYVGSAAFAFPWDDGAYHPNGVDMSGNGTYRWTWDHVTFGTTTAAGDARSTAAIFSQRAMYATSWNQIQTHKYTYGLALLVPRLAAETVLAGGTDTSTLTASRLSATYPLIVFDNIAWTSESVEYFGGHGPYMLVHNQAGLKRTPAGNTFTGFYIEMNGGAPATSGPFTILQGDSHVVSGGGLGNYINNSWFQWSATRSRLEYATLFETVGQAGLKVLGDRNTLQLQVGDANNKTTAVSDEGSGNDITVVGTTGHRWEADRPWSIAGQRGGTAGLRTNDFITSGMGATPFYNQADLWFTPQEMNMVASGATAPVLVYDKTLESGAYLRLTASAGQYNVVSQFHRQPFLVGTHLPPVHARVWIKARAASGTPTGSFDFATDGAAVSRGATTPALTTSWQIFSWDVTLESATVGQFIGFYVNANTTEVATDVAWVGLELLPFHRANAVSADVGNAAKTLTVGTDAMTQVWNTALTADRAVTLSTTGAKNGDRFRVVRTAAATGAFALTVGTGPLISLYPGQEAVVEYNGGTTAWMLVGSGPLTTQYVTFAGPTAARTYTGPDANATLEYAGSAKVVGSGGTSISKHLSATASLDFAAWGGTDCQDLTVTVTGAADGNAVTIGVPLALSSTAGVAFTGFVSAANTVTVRGCKVTAGASADPAGATVRADIWQH